MSTTYFLTFLLALVALSAAATARQNDEARSVEPHQTPSTTHFHSRSLGKIKTHQSKSIEKSPDDLATQRAKLKSAGARRTMEREMGKTIDRDRTAEGSMSTSDATNKNGRAMPEARTDYFVSGFNRKTATAESEEGTTRKPVGYRGKATDIREYDENMHQ